MLLHNKYAKNSCKNLWSKSNEISTPKKWNNSELLWLLFLANNFIPNGTKILKYICKSLGVNLECCIQVAVCTCKILKNYAIDLLLDNKISSQCYVKIGQQIVLCNSIS